MNTKGMKMLELVKKRTELTNEIGRINNLVESSQGFMAVSDKKRVDALLNDYRKLHDNVVKAIAIIERKKAKADGIVMKKRVKELVKALFDAPKIT